MAENENTQNEKKAWEASINEEYELRRLEAEAQREKDAAEQAAAQAKEKKQLDGKAIGKFLGFERSDAVPESEKEKASAATGKDTDGAEKEDSRMIIWWLPGFRSHTTWKMIAATLLYAFLIFDIYTTAQYQMEQGVVAWRAVLGPLISYLIAPVFAGNPAYFDHYIPFLKDINVWFRRLLRVTIAFILFVGGLML